MGGGSDAGGDVYTQRLFTALSKYMGPLSGTRKLLIIDGETERGIAGQIDFMASQGYGLTNDGALVNDWNNYAQAISIQKLIMTDWTQRSTLNFNGLGILGFYGMAAWAPGGTRKGGTGMYGCSDNYDNNDPYRILRNMIQIMNPATK